MKAMNVFYRGLISAGLLLATALAANAKDCKWTVKGKVLVEHQLSELKTKFGDKSALKGIEVKVSAKSKVGFVWGTYDSWGTVRTDANGFFSISKERGCGDRRFKIEVKFQDDDLEVRHEHSTSNLLTDVKWYTVVDDAERSEGVIDFGEIVFKAGGIHDRGNMEARKHADIWKLEQMVIEHAKSMGSDFAFTTQLKIKHPHNSDVVNDDREASYCNPTTKVIYIFEKHFNTSTILHETGHLWAYNHMSGEICLTETLLMSGDTHGLVDDHCTAFGEGFAEWWKDKMMEELFGTAAVLPYSRDYLSYGGLGAKLTNLSLMQRHDMGWRSVLHTLTTADVHKYDFGQPYKSGPAPASRITVNSAVPAGCTSPALGFQNLLNVFNDNSAKGYSKKLARDETTITAFLNRAETILDKMTSAHLDMYRELVDPSKFSQPADWLCPTRVGNTNSNFKIPAANKGAASLIFFYYGDSKYNTLGQETLKLKKAMEGYAFKVLLKHETLPSWADLSEADEKLADIKDLPTQANLFKYLIKLADDGYYVDLFIFSHGWEDKFKASSGSHGSTDYVTADDLKNELAPAKTGFAQMPIRIVWGTNCYGQTLGETWRSVGAKTTAGARYVNFYPNAFSPFIDDWNKGSVSFDEAVKNADTDAVRTAAQLYIANVHAPSTKKDWGGCPFGKTVLGDAPCAKDYFTSEWIADDEWQAGKSGKENMNHSSFMFRGGDKYITKNTKPTWSPAIN
jgi:hypothetical protein